MSQPRNGPYEVIEVFTNGTIMIRKGAVTHRVNIGRQSNSILYMMSIGKRMT